MKRHCWSNPIPVYEGIDMVVCRGCNAIILKLDEPNDEACQTAELPLDCEAACEVVANGAYKAWTEGPWNEEDKPEWPVHYSHYSDQPYVRFACDETDHYVWSHSTDLPLGVYEADEQLYTFNHLRVTCHACKASQHFPKESP
jgi:hypothetical protein